MIRRCALGKTRILAVLVSALSILTLALANSQAIADNLVAPTPTGRQPVRAQDYPGPVVTQYPIMTKIVQDGSVTIHLSYSGVDISVGQKTPGFSYPSYPSYPAPAQNTLAKIILVSVDSNGTPITHLTHPLTIAFDYSQLDLTRYNVNLLRIYWSEDGLNWTPLETHVDTQNHLAWAVVYHLSTFTLAAPYVGAQERLVFIPAVMHVSDTGW